MTYKVLTYTSLILSLFAVGSLIAILVGNFFGIDIMLYTAYTVFGLAVLSILVRAVVIEMLRLSKQHNIVAISICFLIPIIIVLYSFWFTGDSILDFLSTYGFGDILTWILKYGLLLIPIYYLVIRNKMPRLLLGLFFMCFIIAYYTSDGLEIPMKDGEVLSVFSSDLVSSLLYTFYFLIVIASLSMVYFGFFKNRN